MAILTIHNTACNLPTVSCVEYGYLYNWYAATDARKVTSSDDWSVPTYNTGATTIQFATLRTYLGTDPGGKAKETGLVYWNSPNTGATNEVNFNGRGNGFRVRSTGAFSGKNIFGSYMTQTLNDAPDNAIIYVLTKDATTFSPQQNVNNSGYSLRFVRPATASEQLLADGTYVDNYVGNDLTQYLAVKIGTQVWTAENLAETEYRDGTPIPTVENATTWAGLTTGAKCAYDNNYSYVGCGETAPPVTTTTTGLPVTTTTTI